MPLENAPRVSRRISGFYVGTAVALFVLAAIFALLPMEPQGFRLASIPLVLVGGLMLIILRSLYRTRYIPEGGELLIETTWMIAGPKRVPLSKIESMSRTLMPFALRLFGASFHGGHYYVPGLGRAFAATTNFDDIVLIETEEGRYLITPSRSDDFIRTVMAAKEASSG